jgi:lipoprotein-releasing system ATP-binding protein
VENEVVEAREIRKVFNGPAGQLDVLRGVSLSLRRGEVVSVLGPSGAGKSTLLHILGTLEQPTSGRVLYEGRDVTSFTSAERARFRGRTVGFVFQFHYLLPELTAEENVMLPALIAGVRRGEAESRASELLSQVGLAARAAHRPAELSGGEQQRIAVARALVNRPAVVFADEPTGNLDRRSSDLLVDLLLHLNRERATTFLMVTHNEGLASRAQRCLYLADGTIGA